MSGLGILFETHSTSLDNEFGLASGHFDALLSERGLRQAAALGQRHIPSILAAVVCSDLRRSYQTAECAFAGTAVRILRDRRLRECDYGDMTRRPVGDIECERARRVTEPFPNGESYEQVAARVRTLLCELREDFAGETVLIVGHRATQYALEHLANDVPLAQAVNAPWQWQPGWTYQLRRRP